MINKSIEQRDRATLQRLADNSPTLGRHLVRKLLMKGSKVQVIIESKMVPVRSLRSKDHLRYSTLSRRSLVEPLSIQLLWCPRRARLFACDCAKRSLQRFASICEDFPSCAGRCLNDPRPSQAISIARQFAQGKTDLASLIKARSGAWEATGRAWEAVWEAWEAVKNRDGVEAALNCERVAVGIEACEGAARENPSEAALSAAASAVGSARELYPEEVRWQQDRLLAYLLGEIG